MIMDYYYKRINLGEGRLGIEELMDWIKANGCPDLRCTEIGDTSKNPPVFMVSKGYAEQFNATLDAIDAGIYSWKEYNGMKFFHEDHDMWVLFIDNNYYWATR